MRSTLRIGTRGSKLARWQADWVAERLRAFGHHVEIVEITTRGDSEQSNPLQAIGAPGLFTKEIQRAVLAGEADLAVHSLKDLPTEPVDGLVLAALPTRESSADVLVLRAGSGWVAGVELEASPQSSRTGGSLSLDPSHPTLHFLPRAARVGTGSLRRQAQLRHARPDLRVDDIRGNVDTRLRKLDEGQFDAILLAEAGLKRLGLADRISQVLPFSLMLPAVGQGALAIECRADDAKTQAAVERLDDAATRVAVLAERSLLAHLRGGCLAPIGAWGRIENGAVQLSAVVLSSDGAQRLDASDSAPPAEAESLGRRVADALIFRGAAALIHASRLAFPG
jgi:hydroxymethylbilane synthase